MNSRLEQYSQYLTGKTDERPDLTDWVFTGEEIHGLDLAGALLCGAKFNEAELGDVDFGRAELRSSNFRFAKVDRCNFKNADFTYAYLDHAEFSHCDFFGAEISGCDFDGATFFDTRNILLIGPIGSRSDTLVAVQHENCIMLKTGCFYGNLDKFVEAVNRTHHHPGDLAVLLPGLDRFTGCQCAQHPADHRRHLETYLAAVALIKKWSEFND